MSVLLTDELKVIAMTKKTHRSSGMMKTIGIATAFVIACGGCGGSDELSTGHPSSGTAADPGYFFGNLRAMSEGRHTIQRALSLSEWLPNQEFSTPGEPPAPLAEATVYGNVTDVSPGRGYYVPGDGSDADAEGGTVLDFDDPRAPWRVLEVTIKPIETLGAKPGPDLIRVGVVVDGPDRQALIEGVRSLGEVIVIVDKQGFFTYDPSLYSVADFGNLFGDVGARGEIVFPAFDEETSIGFVGDLRTWKAVREDARTTKSVIELGPYGRVSDPEKS